MTGVTFVSGAIRLFKQMAKERLSGYEKEPATLGDNGPTEPVYLNGDPHYEYQRTDLEILCDLDFLEHGRGAFKLTEKAERLVTALKARETEMSDLIGPRLDWIVVAHCGVFMDEGSSPPNLRALMGEQWQPGDRIVTTCHEPEYLLVSHLPLALAGDDRLFESDLQEVAMDFK